MNLQIRNLSKTYSNGIAALKDVSLDIPTGMFGLLGPNGAGKTTLMRILATLLDADHGTVHLGELNILKEKIEVKKVLGYLPQEFGFYPKDRAYDFLDHFASLKGLRNRSERQQAVEDLLRRVNLWDARGQRLGTFSGGMKQRLAIAQALLGNPKLIIVDEPTAGLDPTERNRFHNLLSEIGEDIVVILSTHIVEDVMHLCTNMAIINNGEILLAASPLDVISSLEGKLWGKEIDKHELPKCRKTYNVISSRLFAGRTIIHIYCEDDPGNGFSSCRPTLEDGYFYHLSTN